MFDVSDSLSIKYDIATIEAMEIHYYIRTFEENFFQNLNELNNYITENDEWEDYPSIRSLNTHQEYRNIKGIQPKYYSIVCKELEIGRGNGRLLTKYSPY